MKNKLLATILMLTLTAGLAAGCGKKDVDYSLDSEAGTDVSDSNGMEQYRTAGNWTDEWAYTDDKGQEQILKVDAEIAVPDVEHMRVVSTKRYKSDMNFWKKGLDAFFGEDTTYYYGDYDHWTKTQIEENIAKMGDGIDVADMSTWPDYEKERYWNAPDEPIVVEEFSDNNELYVAYKEGTAYNVALSPGNLGIYQSMFVDDYYRGPESLRERRYVGRSNIEIDEEMPNECRYSKEEAKALADTYVNEIGLGGIPCNYSRENLWKGGNDPYGNYDKNDEYVRYGYTFDYATGVDGVTFNSFPSFRTVYANDWNSGGVLITVEDDGVCDIILQDPEIITDMSDPVELLPFDNIKEMIKSEALENSNKYRFNPNRTANKLQLVYMAVKNPKEEDSFTYIPVWAFSSVIEMEGYAPEYLFSILVNAIDGSIIEL